MSARLIILGGGGGAVEILDIVDALSLAGESVTVAGILDDAASGGDEHLGVPVLGPLSVATCFPDCSFINTIGSDKNFRRRAAVIQSTGLGQMRFATLVHPKAAVSMRAALGVGVSVNAGVTVSGGARIGNYVHLGAGVIIGHDTVISDYTIVAPGAVVSGFVEIGRSCYIGAGASVKQRVLIGHGALVGMGAVVVRDVGAGVLVFGNPATPRKNKGYD